MFTLTKITLKTDVVYQGSSLLLLYGNTKCLRNSGAYIPGAMYLLRYYLNKGIHSYYIDEVTFLLKRKRYLNDTGNVISGYIDGICSFVMVLKDIQKPSRTL